MSKSDLDCGSASKTNLTVEELSWCGVRFTTLRDLRAGGFWVFSGLRLRLAWAKVRLREFCARLSFELLCLVRALKPPIFLVFDFI